MFGSEVTIFARSSTIMVREDEEAAQVLTERFVRDGIRLVMNASYERCEKRADGSKVLVYTVEGGEPQEIVADQFLVAVGRIPNVVVRGCTPHSFGRVPDSFTHSLAHRFREWDSKWLASSITSTAA